MKKLFLFFVLAFLPIVASADAVEIDGIYYNLVSKLKQAEVTRNPNKYKGIVVIPASVTNNAVEYSVTSIGSNAFSSCFNLTSITIPNSVTSIGNNAFSHCIGLTSITIPNSVTSIGYSAFSSCSGLTSVTMGNSVTSIGSSAFSGCSSLTSVTIPNSVTNIESGAFSNCSGLTAVTIPNSVASIGNYVFYGCSGLTSVTIPNSVTSIGNQAFEGCSGLTSITIPNSVTSIGYSAFSNCSSLTSVTIGSGVKKIYSQAFASCPELADVYCLAESVPTTASDAFQDSYIDYATLHVPAASVEAYRAKEPWKNFGSIVAIDGETPEPRKCATPTISYQDGKLTFECETEGATCHYSITDGNSNVGTGNEVSLSTKYIVTVYATKEGYEDSEVVTKEITIGSGGLKGDMNGDGVVDLTDAIIVVYMSLGAEM